MEILSTTPSQKEVNVRLLQQIEIKFDTEVDASTVEPSSITVSTNKPSVVKVENGLPQPNGIFGTDDFFSDGSTGMVDGTISVSGDTIIFTPNKPYRPDSEYTVTISSAIAGTDASALGRIKYFTFKTASEDLALDPLPAAPKGLTKVIGTDLTFEQVSTSETFYVKSTTPKKDSFLITSSKIKITFNKDIDPSSGNKVNLLRYDLFSDYPPEELDLDVDYNVAVDTNRLTITLLDSGIKPNSIYEIVVDSTINSIDAETLSSDYSFTYINELSPYYTSTKLLRLKAGTVLSAYTDVNLALMIHYASLEADEKLSKVNIDQRSRDILRSKYALYSAIESILVNNYNFGISDYVSKQLAEFSLSVSSKSKVNLYNQLLEDARNFKKTFDSYINFACSKGYFIKNARPTDIGRMWHRGVQPGLNAKMITKDGQLINVWDTIGEPIQGV